MSSRIRRSLASPSMVVALLALLVALAGTSVAATTMVITSANIKNQTITGADIKLRTLTSAQIATNTLTGTNIKDGTIGAVDLSAATKASLKGLQGERGRDGAQGDIGPAGPTGPAGPAGSAKAYASISVPAGKLVCTLGAHSDNVTGCARVGDGVFELSLVRGTLSDTYPTCSVSDGATSTPSTTLRWCGAAIGQSVSTVVVKYYDHAPGTAPVLVDPPSTNPVTLLVP